jgi:hypothetical protein
MIRLTVLFDQAGQVFGLKQLNINPGIAFKAFKGCGVGTAFIDYYFL